MPLPAVIWGIIEISAFALTAYEAYSAVNEIYEGLDDYKRNLDEAKKSLEKTIKKLQEEIDQKISEMEEAQILLKAAKADRQGQETRRATGRGSGKPIINAAIEQKIPFRKIITEVCDQADRMPVLQLRKKSGAPIKAEDVPKLKSKLLKELVKRGVEVGTDMEDFDHFTVVQLKQLAASLMFDFIDYTLEWKSPLKCEVTFGPPKTYTDHPLEEGSTTRLKRAGTVYPYYPFPAPNNRRDSISADLIITDYRKKRCDKNNIFAIVEIKFPNDRINVEQFKNYRKLLKIASTAKTATHPARFNNDAVTSGGRLSLFRYPEDRWPDDAKEQQPGKPHGKGRSGGKG